MSEPPDPVKILDCLNPIERADVEGAAFSQEAHATLESILRQPATMPSRKPRPARRRRLLVAAAVAVAATASGTAWALTRSSSQPITVGCYAAPTTAARTLVLPAGVSPVATCLEVWHRGDFGSPRNPRLRACLLPSGGVGVFPGLHQCADLSLQPLGTVQPSRNHHAQRGSPIELKNHLVHAYLHSRCLSRTAGLQLARSQTRRIGLEGWRVRVTAPFTSERNCTSYAFDEQRHLVLIVPTTPR